MTATPQASAPASRQTDWMGDAMQKRIARRYAAERRFKFLGLAAVALSSLFLAFLLVVMIGNGAKGFVTTEATLTIDLPAATGSISPDQLTEPRLAATMASIDVRRIFDRPCRRNMAMTARAISPAPPGPPCATSWSKTPIW